MNVSRDFNFVYDIAEGFTKSLLNKKTIGQVINLGSGLETKLIDLIKYIDNYKKKIIIKITERRKRPINSEVFRLIADNKKALRL